MPPRFGEEATPHELDVAAQTVAPDEEPLFAGLIASIRPPPDLWTTIAAKLDLRLLQVRNFRIDLIHEAETLNESFALQDGFTIAEYAAQAFGVWQDPAQYGEVVWRFAPGAAGRAAGFRFHPQQVLEPQADGSLIVRFHAAGWLEMAWHLYQWGDKVEVMAPQALRDMVEGHRRSDFAAMP